MAKAKSIFICSECGYESAKWAGRCSACGAWNSFSEEIVVEEKPKKQPMIASSAVSSAKSVRLNEISAQDELRTRTGLKEFDRVLGGGIVQGSLVLVSGEPGIGKSTVLLQICLTLAASMRILYVSGEESPRQIKLRADRLGSFSPNLFLLPETNILSLQEHIDQVHPDLIIVDSIQTMYRDDMPSSPGSVPQVRECTSHLMQLAKGREIPIFIVGHVNKEGSIAGPKVMEHMVDAVLYIEGERSSDFRILRAVKNRFGSTNEIGVFEMTASGLREVENPSLLFLQDKPAHTSGIATLCIMEGTRPLIAEVQALVAKTPFPTPRRTSVGLDYNRLNILLAVLEKRCNFFFGASDVYVNVIGGLRLDEPAADLAVAMALASATRDFLIPEKTLMIGEIGLAGELRAVSAIDRRIGEAVGLGFDRIIYPARNRPIAVPGIELVPARTIKDVLNA